MWPSLEMPTGPAGPASFQRLQIDHENHRDATGHDEDLFRAALRFSEWDMDVGIQEMWMCYDVF